MIEPAGDVPYKMTLEVDFGRSLTPENLLILDAKLSELVITPSVHLPAVGQQA